MFVSELADGWIASIVNAAGLAGIFVPLERYFGRRPDDPRERPLHLLYLATNFLVWTPLTTALLYLILGYLPTAWLKGALDGTPPALRFALAILACDLSVYWFHRAIHHYSLLWRIHRVHHAPVHLDWLAA